MDFEKIAVVDFGGQYAHLIATKIRRLNVLSEIVDPMASLEEFRQYRGIVLSGSPAMASAGDELTFRDEIFDLPIPILGFCFGHQEIAKRYGGAVENSHREYGHAELHIIGSSPIFAGLDPVERVWMSHGDTVTSVGPDFVELAYSTTGDGDHEHRFAAIASERHRRYGFQYHPEVDDTVNGQKMLANFVLDICGCEPNWTPRAFRDQIMDDIRATVGHRKVLLLASGGVDSTVTARLLQQALGADRLWLVHVDNGMMRKDESARVVELLASLGLGASVHAVDASKDFLDALDGVVEPEKKREIIGNTFIDVSNRHAAELNLDDFVLAQGTIYPDCIETGGSAHADVIKTHHNRVAVVEQMIADGRVVEPLKELYKVEVRELGRELGIDPDAIDRHPFPGPGLGIRVLCATGDEVHDLSASEKALARVLQDTPFDGRVLPLRSVGVKADLRSYEHAVMLQHRPGLDGLPRRSQLLALAARIYKDVPGINRCVLELSGAALTEIQPVAASLTRSRLDLLREIDAWVMSALDRHNLMATIWQCPTVLLPLGDGKRTESIIVRPVLSERGMTASPADLPLELMRELVDEIRRHHEIHSVSIDLTTKPPGTIEWE